ncbi:hypothetical protein PMAYCL1PPCAC_16479, partial [Pristionchus mayeri]
LILQICELFVQPNIMIPQILCLHIAASSVGIVMLISMEWKRRTKKHLAHKSLTILMEMHGFWTFLLCLATLVNSSITMRAHLRMDSPSDLNVDASTCLVCRAPAMLGVLVSIFSQVAMAAERYRASNNLEKYEQTNGAVGISLNAIHIAAVALFWFIHCLFYGTGWRAIHCTVVNPTETPFNMSLAVI